MSTSHREILRSSAIVGSSSIANIGFALVRMKVAALLLGPGGIGLIGLLQNLMTTAATLAGLGVGGSATREIAAKRHERGAAGEGAARAALLILAAALGIGAMLTTWLLRGPIASGVLHDPSLMDAVGWLSIGIGLTVIASAQMALFAGLRRLDYVAKSTIVSGLVATIFAIFAITVWRERAIVAFVIALPLATVLVGALFGARLPRPPHRAERRHVLSSGRRMLALGAAIMIGGVLSMVGQLAVRSLVVGQLGLAPLGQFQAAFAISSTYLGFVLQAMGTDYYPRLAQAIEDEDAANRLIGEQAEVAVLLGAPILLFVMGAAPWLLHLLFSSQFTESAMILRWQIVGDLLRLASWPVSFLLLAANRGRAFVAAEAVASLVFVAATALLLPRVGIEATGAAFCAMYVVYFPLVTVMARRISGYRWPPEQLATMAVLLIFLAGVAALGTWSPLAGLTAGLVLSAGVGVAAIRRLESSLPLALARVTSALGITRRRTS